MRWSPAHTAPTEKKIRKIWNGKKIKEAKIEMDHLLFLIYKHVYVINYFGLHLKAEMNQ